MYCGVDTDTHLVQTLRLSCCSAAKLSIYSASYVMHHCLSEEEGVESRSPTPFLTSCTPPLALPLTP